MKVQSGGNVGIGTTSPATRIHIKGSGTNEAKVRIESVEGDHPSVNFHDGATQIGVVGWYRTDDALKFLYAGTLASSNGITVKSTGNVGIGTSDPSVKLDIIGGSIMATTSDNASLTAHSTNTDSRSYLTLISSTSTEVQRELRLVNDGPEGGEFHFFDATNDATRMVIDENGKVGIGTTDPKEKFQIGDRLTFHDGGWKNISYNSYYSISGDVDKRIASGCASAINFRDNGDISFRTAPTGAADSDIFRRCRYDLEFRHPPADRKE